MSDAAANTLLSKPPKRDRMARARCIVAVAIRQNGVIYSLPAPARHDDVIRHILKCREDLSEVAGEQGFLTNEGVFVGREAASKIAIDAAQCDPQDMPLPDRLFSEDVW